MFVVSLISVARVVFNNALYYILINSACTQFTGLSRVSSNWNPLFLCLFDTPKLSISFNNRSVNNFSMVFSSLFFGRFQNHPATPGQPLPHPVNCALADGYTVERGGKPGKETLLKYPFKKPLDKSWETGWRDSFADLNHPAGSPRIYLFT